MRATPSAPIAASARAWLASSRGQAAVAFTLYGALTLAYFAAPIFPHLRHLCVCEGGDADVQMWFLVWWQHALLHGQNPFLTNVLFAPNHLNLGALTLAPGAAIAALPVTILFGPILAYNLLALASPVLAAFFAFLLCRYVTRSFPAALFGGYVFGFSSYMLGHMLGHLTLVLTFPIPAAVLLTLKLIDGNIGRRRFVVLMALCFAALFLFSTEVTFTFTVLGGLAFALTFGLAPGYRAQIRGAVPLVLGAGALSILLTAPFVYYALTGDVTMGFFSHTSNTYVADATGFLVPTAITRLGRAWFAPVANAFTGNLAENGIYVGLPLALIVARYAITQWRMVATRLMVALLAVIGVLMLGDRLHIAGFSTVPLPWKLLSHLPLLDEVLPVRLGLYMFLIVGLMLALWLARGGSPWVRGVKWTVATVALVLLVPNVGSGLWQNHENTVPFFATSAYRHYIQPGETVLALPWGPNGTSMLWQAEADMNFRLADGYLGALLPGDYRNEPILPAFSDVHLVPSAGALRGFLDRHHVRAVVVDARNPELWPQTLAQLGLRPISAGDVLFYGVPSGARS
jgi:hypothetical protein